MRHPAISKNSVAVITGGAAGIGLAAASRFASLGLKVCIADRGVDRLAHAAALLSTLAPSGSSSIMTQETDISSIEEVQKLKAAAADLSSNPIRGNILNRHQKDVCSILLIHT
jgi:NAD(P)-dependent dehydrogenase (short-subunit alcohol dehydrogenase family)